MTTPNHQFPTPNHAQLPMANRYRENCPLANIGNRELEVVGNRELEVVGNRELEVVGSWRLAVGNSAV